ncbi:hypothetical protein CKK34_2431 [Yarrowia sp. E02]|nr:hypothetical protein CKK34_2431 [Yarrowia sp. E02]
MRACDCCRARKVKCDSQLPCKGCVTSKLTCTYNHVPRKKGPKVGGKSASILNKLRLGLDQADLKPPEKLSWNVVSRPLMDRALKHYFANYHPVTPVLDQTEVYSYLTRDPTSETFALVMSIVAMAMGDMLDLEVTTPSSRTQNVLQIVRIVCDALHTQEVALLLGGDHRQLAHQTVTVNSIVTQFNIYGTFCQLEMPSRAFQYLRRAISEAQTAGIDREDFYKNDPVALEPFRTMFWCLYVSERGFALQHNYPTALGQDLPLYPQSEGEVFVGLTQLVKSFSVFSPTFFKLWRDGNAGSSPAGSPNTNSQHTQTVQRLLQYHHANQASPLIPCSPVQKSDILITDQWIRLLLWRLAPYGVQQPADIAKNLVAIADSVPIQTIQAHGAGMMLKIYDIGMTLATVFQSAAHAEQFGIPAYLHRILMLMSQLQSSQHLSVLLQAAQRLLPKLTPERVKNEESSSDTNSGMVEYSARVSESESGSSNSPIDGLYNGNRPIYPNPSMNSTPLAPPGLSPAQPQGLGTPGLAPPGHPVQTLPHPHPASYPPPIGTLHGPGTTTVGLMNEPYHRPNPNNTHPPPNMVPEGPPSEFFPW